MRCLLALFVLHQLANVECVTRTKSTFYNVDKQKLRHFWQSSSVKGLIKAKVRRSLRELPRVEGVVFHECAGAAADTVALAKCAVRVFDAENNAKVMKERNAAEKKIHHYSRSGLVNLLIKKIRPPVYATTDEKFTIYSTKEKDDYSKGYYQSSKGLMKNPIRAQIRRRIRIRRVRRQTDQLTEAFEMFLAEEREKKKSEESDRKLEKLESDLEEVSTAGSEVPGRHQGSEVNFFGLPRRLSRRRLQKREIHDGEFRINSPALALSNTTKPPLNITTLLARLPKVNYAQLADKYLKRVIGGRREPKSTNMENLRRLRDHFSKVDHSNKYFKLMNDENNRFYSRLPTSLKSVTPEVKSSTVEALDPIVRMLNSFASTSKGMSLLSPKLFSIIPEQQNARPRLLSPTLLSFQNDGFFSIPKLFEMVSDDQFHQSFLLDLIMDLSGAAPELQKLVDQMDGEIKRMDETQYPLVQKLSQQDLNWMRAKRTFSEAQHDDLHHDGYAFLDDRQLELIYKSQPEVLERLRSSNITSMSNEEREKRIEQDIRKIAAIGSKLNKSPWEHVGPSRRRRQAHGTDPHAPQPDHNTGTTDEHGTSEEGGGEHGSEEGGEHEHHYFKTLEPYAFTNLVNEGVALEAVTLSPHAFIGEILHPEAIIVQTLSPRAFIATVLSPSALVARILSPTALRAEVLSPRALNAWILSPESMVAEVLTPRFLEPRILSPESLVIDVLSPGILSPHYLSAEVVGVMILSPNVLSPRIESEERMLVEVLSPHILGGHHSEEEIHSAEGVHEVASGHVHTEDHKDVPEHEFVHVIP